MSRRADRQQRSQERRSRESRRRLIKRTSWVAGFVLILVVFVTGGILYAGSQKSSGQAQLSPSTGLEVGSNVGNQVPEFDLRLVDGSTVNSAELVSTNNPAFYFFFATW